MKFSPSAWLDYQPSIIERARAAAAVADTAWADCSSLGPTVTVAFYSSESDLLAGQASADNAGALEVCTIESNGTVTVT